MGYENRRSGEPYQLRTAALPQYSTSWTLVDLSTVGYSINVTIQAITAAIRVSFDKGANYMTLAVNTTQKFDVRCLRFWVAGDAGATGIAEIVVAHEGKGSL